LNEILVDIHKSIYVALEKLNYRQRRRRQFLLNQRKYERALRSAANEFFAFLTKEVRKGLGRARGKTPSAIVESMANWGYIKGEGRKIFNGPLSRIAASGSDAVGRFEKQERTDPIGQASTSWANSHAGSLVAGLTNETMQALRTVVRTGIDQGKSIPEIARELRPIIGLNNQQAGAVGSLATKLEEEGLAQADIDKALDRYMNKAHLSRALTIARTETASALNEGAIIGYKDAGIKRLMRVEDPDCCERFCQDHQGQIYTIGEASGVLPAHPNCEGTWVSAE
jgi:hypothetical protein